MPQSYIVITREFEHQLLALVLVVPNNWQGCSSHGCNTKDPETWVVC
jgi:hypothetical protein